MSISGKLAGDSQRWAQRKLVPKVLVANQTRLIEAVADPDGAWLPGVPVNTVTPTARDGHPSTRRRTRARGLGARHRAHVAGRVGARLAVGSRHRAVDHDDPDRAGTSRYDSVADGRPVGRGEALRAATSIAARVAVVTAYGIGEPTPSELLSWWRRAAPRPRLVPCRLAR